MATKVQTAAAAALVVTMKAALWWNRKAEKAVMALLPLLPGPPDESPVASDGFRIDPEALAFVTESPLLAARRIKLSVDEVIGMVQEALSRRGVPVSASARGRWVWVGREDGAPDLYLIMPSIQS